MTELTNIDKVKVEPINKIVKAEFIDLKCKREDYKTEAKYIKEKNFYNNSYYENVFKLNDTEYYPLQKHNLKTSFCFGYGNCLQSSDEEENSAYDMSRKARTDVTYFLNENLQEVNETIAVLKYFLIPQENYEERKNYFEKCYKDGTMRYHQQFLTPYICSYYEELRGVEVKLSYFDEDKETDQWIIKQPYVLRKASEEELKIILHNYIQYRLRLIKRLNTYLKKYGLDHIESWTYLRD